MRMDLCVRLLFEQPEGRLQFLFPYNTQSHLYAHTQRKRKIKRQTHNEKQHKHDFRNQ